MYTLTFTIYSLLFSLLLFITFLMKKKKSTVRSKMYFLIMISAMIVALFEIIAITVFLNYSQNLILLRINWFIRMIFIFVYVALFMIYYDILMNGEKYDTILATIFKCKRNLIISIVFALIIIFYLIFNIDFSLDINNVTYVSGVVGILTVVISFSIAFYLLFVAVKVRKERRNVYNCFALIFLLLVIVVPIQLVFPNISLMPMCMLYILYVVFHNIEDPDIDLLDDVFKLKNSIESSSSSKSDFLFNLSYDLISPINVINSLVTNVYTMDTYDRNRIVDDYNNIISASNLVLSSVNDMVDFSLDSEKVNFKEYNMYELLSKLRTVTISKLGKKQVLFDLNIDSNVNSKYFGELDKIKKVLSILLNNACKYTSVGKIKLDVSASNNNDVHSVTFRVYDTGCGMNEETQKLVFDGQELLLCKNLIEGIGGTISFKSILGGGSSFYFTINQKPIGNNKAVDDVSFDNNSEEIVYHDLSNYKVLIVDDIDVNNKVNAKLLSKYKFNVTAITSSAECIERIKSEEPFDLVFIDHKMKDIDGIEVVQLLRSLEGYNIPKMICLTANVFTGARDYYLSKGFDEYLAKPVDIHELDRIVNKFIKRN